MSDHDSADLSSIHPHSTLGQHLAESAASLTQTLSPHHRVVEIVTFDPTNEDTYPSVCVDPGEVKERFGFVGGERLVFDHLGNYIGQLVKELE